MPTRASRVLPAAALERYCEIIAALKLRTTNGKGRHLSTGRAIALLEEHGVETPDGHVRPAPGLLKQADRQSLPAPSGATTRSG